MLYLLLLAMLFFQRPPAPVNLRILTDPPPPTILTRGPQPWITCPTGSRRIDVSENINVVTNSNGSGTSYCIGTGVHRPTEPIYVQTGDTFTGEFGAVIDGANVTRDWDVSGIAIISGWNCEPMCTHVTIRNLVVRNTAQHICIGAYGRNLNDSTTWPNHWTIDHNEVTDCNRGITFGNASYQKVTNNIVRRVNPGGLASQTGEFALFDNNEVGWMGHESKLFRLKDSIVRRSWFHHGSNGLWLDSDNERVLVEDNLSEDMAGECYFYEASATGTFRRNVGRRCGLSGLFISISRDGEYYNNTFTDVWRGINLFVDCNIVRPANFFYPGSIEFDLRNNHIHDNTINLGTRSDSIAATLSFASSCNNLNPTYFPNGLTPYISNAKMNTWQGNNYDVPTITGTWWFWPPTLRTWAQWQTLNQDTSGTIR